MICLNLISECVNLLPKLLARVSEFDIGCFGIIMLMKKRLAIDHGNLTLIQETLVWNTKTVTSPTFDSFLTILMF